MRPPSLLTCNAREGRYCACRIRPCSRPLAQDGRCRSPKLIPAHPPPPLVSVRQCTVTPRLTRSPLVAPNPAPWPSCARYRAPKARPPRAPLGCATSHSPRSVAGARCPSLGDVRRPRRPVSMEWHGLHTRGGSHDGHGIGLPGRARLSRSRRVRPLTLAAPGSAGRRHADGGAAPAQRRRRFWPERAGSRLRGGAGPQAPVLVRSPDGPAVTGWRRTHPPLEGPFPAAGGGPSLCPSCRLSTTLESRLGAAARALVSSKRVWLSALALVPSPACAMPLWC